MKNTEKWDKRYLGIAKEVSTWSKDPSTKVGAVIVGNADQIVSQAYNGFPRGVIDSEERYNDRETKYKYVIHAEMNAIYNAIHSGSSTIGCSIYITGLPVCSECAKGIIQSGITKVVMQKPNSANPETIRQWEESTRLSLSMFKEANVECLYIN